MSRWPQGKKELGSQKWLQKLINERPQLANATIGQLLNCRPDEIHWKSPLESDEFAEYRDQCAFGRIGARLEAHQLHTYWPANGPQWDGLANAGEPLSRIILVEAKSHLCEFCSTACGARNQSLARIQASLAQTRLFLGSTTRTDWSKSYYQYANRLAHLYLLRELNRLDAFLVFIYFLNDEEMGGPRTIDEWRTVIELAERSLGVHGHPFLQYAPAIFIDVRDLQGT